MRAIRGWAIAAMLVLPAGTAAAQATRGFRDAWFWGFKGGVLSYQVQSDTNPLALLGGVDWLITRSQGGMYVSFDHSFINNQLVFVNDSVSPLDILPRAVTLSGLRRFTVAGVLFPMQSNRVQPYVGFGVSLSHITEVEPQGTYRNGVQRNLVQSTVQAFRTAATPVVIVGTQLKIPFTSAFGQLTVSPANSNFFLFTGSGLRATLEAGFRHNVGGSIDRMR